MEATAGSKFLRHSSTTIRPSLGSYDQSNFIDLSQLEQRGDQEKNENVSLPSHSVPGIFRPFIRHSIHSLSGRFKRSIDRFASSLYLSKLHFNEWDALGKSLSNPTKHSNKHHSSSVINCRLKLRGPSTCWEFAAEECYRGEASRGPDLIRFTFFLAFGIFFFLCKSIDYI